jgi:transposase
MNSMSNKRERRTHSEEFKHQIVQLYNTGKPKAEICREYDLAHSLLDRWTIRINSTGSSKECNNRTPEEVELVLVK